MFFEEGGVVINQERVAMARKGLISCYLPAPIYKLYNLIQVKLENGR